MNLYHFNFNNSINRIDNLGRESWIPNYQPQRGVVKAPDSGDISDANDTFDQMAHNMFDGSKPHFQNAYFGSDHPWTRLMKAKPVYERMRNRIRQEMKKNCQNSNSGGKLYTGSEADPENRARG